MSCDLGKIKLLLAKMNLFEFVISEKTFGSLHITCAIVRSISLLAKVHRWIWLAGCVSEGYLYVWL